MKKYVITELTPIWKAIITAHIPIDRCQDVVNEEELERRLHRLIDIWGATESNTVWIKKAKRILLTGNDTEASNT